MQEVLENLIAGIVPVAAPVKILQYHEKYKPNGEPLSVKLCIVTPRTDVDKIEHELYVTLDCDVPFDLLVYDTEEWEHLINTPLSFAKRIQETGRVLYEKNQTQ